MRMNGGCLLNLALLSQVLIDPSEALCAHISVANGLTYRCASGRKSRQHLYEPYLKPTISLTTSKSSYCSATSLGVSNSPTKLAEAKSSDDNEDDDVNQEAAIVATSAFSTIANGSVSRFRKLKDIMWVREAVEDLTAAEFACSVESSAREEANKKRKRAVDYEKLLSQLDRRVGDMMCIPFEEINGSEPTIDDGNGMGRFAYTREERKSLLKRILKTRKNLVEVIKGHSLELEIEEENAFPIKMPEIPELSIPKEEEAADSAGPKLYVRDDGTVDWEGALQDRAALRKFGGAVWARINGQTPSDVDEDDESEGTDKPKTEAMAHQPKAAVTVKIEETPAIRDARKALKRLQDSLKEVEKSHTALLNSGIQAGQATGNVKLASLDPELRSKIRESADLLAEKVQMVSYQTLAYELERIYTYLAAELGNPLNKGYIPLQDRLNVAEYGLLEGQVENCSRDLSAKGVLDSDILAVIAEQMTDFKRRLGIDYYVTGLTYDKEAIQTWLNDLLRNTRNGLMFYVKGCRLFWNDLLYCTTLIARAAQGYTLKPREVRTIRRTFKDIITFIPVVIILIIPLSPVGHVLVFGAIQRFFPDFFPSCFTEQRQNLLQLYETTEFTEFTIKETFGERFSRFVEAVAFSVASKTRSTLFLMSKPKEEETTSKQDNSTD